MDDAPAPKVAKCPVGGNFSLEVIDNAGAHRGPPPQHARHAQADQALGGFIRAARVARMARKADMVRRADA